MKSEKEQQRGSITFPDFTTHKVLAEKQTRQPRNKPSRTGSHAQMVSDQGTETAQQMGLGNWMSTYKRMKLDPYLNPKTKINSTWIKDKNSKTLRRKYREKLHDFDFGNDFFFFFGYDPQNTNAKIKNRGGQVWWCMSIISALRRWRQEDHEFEDSLS
jgi:hypothetical protein